ncbi:sensor histidine kinase [Cryobacterium roopkundense]|uniref:histidine kinase n=1 Tax=Cryobacterium roopkundense TaxID=1001240 RepID=A0A7W8ZUN0_9MICO|nr:histidine kinase [Cryobacterium roopkundense]MBB5640529.1 signal transduction histidine kinase [Cryobacterium roopkundense]
MTNRQRSGPAAVAAGVFAASSARGASTLVAGAPRLGPWSRIWRYLVAGAIGLSLWGAVIAAYSAPRGIELTADDVAVIGGFVTLDLVAGLVAVAVLPARHRHPMIASVVSVGLTVISSFAVGPAMLAVVSMSTRRRWKPAVAIGFLWVGSALINELVLRPRVPGTTSDLAFTWAGGGLAVAVYAVCVSTGFYIGARRELLASLRDRVENAEREQTLRAQSARESERTRIAREMHDVLAHRISLVSLHAGALNYRTDLTRVETAEAATVIQNNAQLALTELRQILGVLRSSDGDEHAEPPQPTLAELPALLADSREAGMDVTMRVVELDLGDGPRGSAFEGLSDSVSRTAYRIVQEALTNARKHAGRAPVNLVLEKRVDELLVVVRNPRGRGIETELRGSGVGLLGLRERAELSGGSLDYGIDRGDRFVVTARLPWA